MKNNIKIMLTLSFALLLAATVLLVNANKANAVVFAQLSQQMGVGSSGANVTNLQTFLASDPRIYPAGLITGYYGLLTQEAVRQFQIAYNLPAVGRVGPLTLAKANEVIVAGYGIDIYAPAISNVSVSKTNNSATISWSNSENARGKIYYSSLPLQFAEAQQSFQEPTVLGGLQTALTANAQIGQNVTITGLSSNTIYYYVIESVDLSGNVAVTLMSSFSTNP